ncbi:MAG: glutamate-ammonia-ligase adenylyltransferase [Desulfobacteraceae bacterium]|nr:MAG: glutamate-ammonia-ligase adenylyltransferase [Desulfobacteraceae bacterium]
MKPDAEWFLQQCPDLDPVFVRQHLRLLGEEYFNSFSKEEQIAHLRQLALISTVDPVRILTGPLKDKSLEFTVLAFDYPWEFSLITGILAGSGFNILSGKVFTYMKAVDSSGEGFLNESPVRRRIIDHFHGTVDTSKPIGVWKEEISRHFSEVISLLERGDMESLNRARLQVNSMVIRRVTETMRSASPVFYPVRIQIDNDSSPCTKMKVISEDTPAFLYSLSTALSIHGIIIERVMIRTEGSRAEDQIDLVDSLRRRITDPDMINKLTLSVLLTKQFTYALGNAPDPYGALVRFGQMIGDILCLPEKERWMELLTNPESLNDLARLLGASDYLWEDFIRLQYETLLPLIGSHLGGRSFSTPPDRIEARLQKALDRCAAFEEKIEALNEFKDRELFLIDLDQILNPGSDFQVLSIKLTALAEKIVAAAAELAKTSLVERFGIPRTVGGMEAKWAVFGLGKLGGKALGYASDIELLLIYSDSGYCDGAEKIDNSDFFERFVRQMAGMIRAKREGIFSVDLRLRPYGNSGPLAVSLDSFCRYYGPGGPAHSYERLALVRLRAIAGDPVLGARIERLRDEIVYAGNCIDTDELRVIREKQYQQKSEGSRLNAKFSAGGLVDLEYGVQALQAAFGKQFPGLRTPVLHEALEILDEESILSPEEADALRRSYFFLRRLINGIRMLRGSAQDLFLPSMESPESEHLARRMGYRQEGGLDPKDQLRIDFETRTAEVRAFVERHFGRQYIPSSRLTSIADVILSDTIPKEIYSGILKDSGFSNPERAYVNLSALAGEGSRRITFAKLAVLASDILKLKPDPDMALNNWERFIHSIPSPEFHYGVMLSQPMRLEIILTLFSWSQFLADTLVRNPGFLDWISIPEILNEKRDKELLEQELNRAFLSSFHHGDWLNELRRIRRREILRVGTRDVCLKAPLEEVMEELSLVAEAFISSALEGCWDDVTSYKAKGKPLEDFTANEEVKKSFCIMAMGKLGGRELNYSSDVDIIGFYDDRQVAAQIPSIRGSMSKIMERLNSDLSLHTEEGYAYRVDLRLRPFGNSGDLVPGMTSLLRYYRNTASPWEIQALLKARPVAGNRDLGYELLKEIWPALFTRTRPEIVLDTIKMMRGKSTEAARRKGELYRDVKTGLGGIRDIEFLVQGLQLIYGLDKPWIYEANTLRALDLLSDASLIPPQDALALRSDYIFLRRIEHCLQIMDDRQIHSIPAEQAEIFSLAKRVQGAGTSADGFLKEVAGCFSRIKDAFYEHLLRLAP